MTVEPTPAYIGLGSNLHDPVMQITRALEALAQLPDSRLRGASSLYQSAPLGVAGQADYINAVAWLDTQLDAEALLDHLQTIETAQGRVRSEVRWSSRSLDLDILLYGQQVIDSPRLQVPHSQLPQRNFVLTPLLELAPELTLADGRSIAELSAACPPGRLQRLADTGPAGLSAS